MNPRNLNYLLSKHAPEVLKELQQQFPEEKNFFSPYLEHFVAGEPEQHADLIAKTEYLKKVVYQTQMIADGLTGKIARRLKKAKKFKTFSSVITAVTNAGVIASFAPLLEHKEIIQPAMATLALASSLMVIFADNLVGGKNGGQLPKYYDLALEQNTRLLKTAQISQRCIAGIPVPAKDIDKAIDTLEDIGLQLIKIEDEIEIV